MFTIDMVIKLMSIIVKSLARILDLRMVHRIVPMSMSTGMAKQLNRNGPSGQKVNEYIQMGSATSAAQVRKNLRTRNKTMALVKLTAQYEPIEDKDIYVDPDRIFLLEPGDEPCRTIVRLKNSSVALVVEGWPYEVAEKISKGQKE
jgi:hypothetical protein